MGQRETENRKDNTKSGIRENTKGEAGGTHLAFQQATQSWDTIIFMVHECP